MQLDITWDAAKAASNLVKHGVPFSQAATVLQDALALTVFDAAHSEFEERWFTLGIAKQWFIVGGLSHLPVCRANRCEGAHYFCATSHPRRAQAVRE